MFSQVKLDRRTYIMGAIVLFVAIVLLICFATRHNASPGAKFKREYESYNNKKNDNGNKYQKLKINSKNKVEYIDLKGAVDKIENGTGIIYFGMPNCPWCRAIVPILLDKIGCSCLENLLYVDMTDERNEYDVSGDLPKETKEASKEYYKLLELLDEFLEDYTITDEAGVEHILNQKRIYLPLVVAVKDGRVVDAHTGSVELEQGQSPFDELNETQKSEVGVIFSNMIDSINDVKTTCEGHC